MSFIQHQRFLSRYKKYYPSFYKTIPYSKFYNQHFQIWNFISSRFQFSIKDNSVLNVLKPKTHLFLPETGKKRKCLKTQKLDSQFEQFLCANRLKIPNIALPIEAVPFYNRIKSGRGFFFFKKEEITINQNCWSLYFRVNKTCNLNKNSYQTIKNTQLKSSFFCKQSFSCKNLQIFSFLEKWRLQPLLFTYKKGRCLKNVGINLKKNNSFLSYSYQNYLVTRALNLYFHQQIRQLQFSRTTFMFWNQYQSINASVQNFVIPMNETHINILLKRQRLIRNSLKGVLLVNFPEKEKNFLIKNLAAENKIALITQSASLLLKDSRNMDDLLGVDDPIQILFDKVKNCIPCICFINNLDRIGKQRYEQEQKSLHGFNHSISLLLDNRFTDHGVSEPINQKKNFTLATSVLSNKTSRFDYDFKKMAIFKRLKIFQTSRFKTYTVEDKCNSYLENLTNTTKRETLIYKLLRINKNFTGLSSIFSFSTPLAKKDGSILLKDLFSASPFKTRFKWRRVPVFFKENGDAHKKAIFNKPFNFDYKHRLPVWLITNSFFFPTISFWPKSGYQIKKYKIDTGKIKLFNSRYYSNTEKIQLESIKLGINVLPLQMTLSKNLANTNNSSLRDKNGFYPERVVGFQHNGNQQSSAFGFSLPVLDIQSTQAFFMNTIKRTSSQKRREKMVRANRCSSTWVKEKPSFKDLGNISIDKTKISLMCLDLNWQTVQNNFQTKPWGGTQQQRAPKFLGSTERKPNKNDRFKITETEIIKRTALLKFLQILDGFYTTTKRRKQVFFPNLNIFGFKTKIKDASTFKTVLKHQCSKLVIRPSCRFKKFNMSKLLLTFPKKPIQTLPHLSASVFLTSKKQRHAFWCSPKSVLKAKPGGETQPKSFKLNRDHKNFLASLVLPNMFYKTTLKPNWLKKKATAPWAQYEYKTGNSKNHFLSHVSQKKTGSPISFINRKSKWQIYLKNQPSLKSLNLLCVWPSYMEEILGSLNINDGACYILPEYFQLLGHGPKLKKQGITLIASTNNLTTLDAALLRPGRFDTIINFSHSSLSIDKFYVMLKHSPSLIQDNQFSSSFNSKKEKPLIPTIFHPIRPHILSYFVSQPIISLGIKGQAETEEMRRCDTCKIVMERQTEPCLFSPYWKQTTRSGKKPFLSRRPGKLLPVFSFIPSIKRNIAKHLKNFFSSQIIVLDIPNQSIPIKTFIDVSVFIQYKLWWSFNNRKFFWFYLYQRYSIEQQQETGVSKSEMFKTFKLNLDNVVLIVKSKIYRIKDLPYIFMYILQIVYFKFFYTISQFSMMLKNKSTSYQTSISKEPTFKNNYGFSLKNQTKLTDKISTQALPIVSRQTKPWGRRWWGNYNSVNDLGREILISKAVTDFRLSLCFGFHPMASLDVKQQMEPTNSKNNINKNYDRDCVASLKDQNLIWTLPKNLHSLNSFLDQYYSSNNKAWMLANLKNQSIIRPSFNLLNDRPKNFIFNFHIKHETMFFRFNRSLLFCIGDFNDKTGFKTDRDLILVGLHSILSLRAFFLENTKKNAFVFWMSKKRKLKGETDLETKQTKNVRQSQITNLINNKNVSNNHFNNETRKNGTFKFPFQDFTKSRDVATAFFDQSSNSWKDNEDAITIKNVNINSTMLTKYNEIYRLKKIKLNKLFFNLHPLTQIMLKRRLELTKSNKLKQHLKVPLINICLPNNYDFTYQKTSNLKENHDPISVNIKKQWNLSLDQKNKQNFSAIQNSWFSNLDLRFLSNETIHNLYNVALLVPINFSLSEKKLEWLKTLSANNFLSTYESYLFKKLSTNSRLNIRCLQIDPNFHVLKKNIDIFASIKKTKYRSLFSNKQKQIKTGKFSSIPLLQTGSRLRKIPRKIVTSNMHEIFETRYKFKCLNAQVDRLEIKNNIILLKNLVSNEKKEHNIIETRESYFQKYKMCRLDLTFFLLIFYTIFFEKIQHKKITLNTIKIFMPYRSLTFSHFLLSQGQTYGFSCKNFEILIYNKFRNFLVNL